MIAAATRIELKMYESHSLLSTIYAAYEEKFYTYTKKSIVVVAKRLVLSAT